MSTAICFVRSYFLPEKNSNSKGSGVTHPDDAKVYASTQKDIFLMIKDAFASVKNVHKADIFPENFFYRHTKSLLDKPLVIQKDQGDQSVSNFGQFSNQVLPEKVNLPHDYDPTKQYYISIPL